MDFNAEAQARILTRFHFALTGVVVLDRELRGLAWNRRAEDLWGLREREVQGKFIADLDMGLPVDELLSTLRACTSEEAESRQTVLTATNRRGRAIACRITCTPPRNATRDNRGAIMLMVEGADGKVD